MLIRVTEKPAVFSLSSTVFSILFGASAMYSYSVYETPMFWIGVGASLLSLSAFMHAQWKSDLVLVIDDYGILDRRMDVGKIFWTDVEEAQLQVTGENRFLCLRMRNMDPYLARLHGPARARLLQSIELGFRTLNVDIDPVDVNLLDLKRAIDLRIRGARNPH